jgi:eukaryotic-like serine/threonine-protein kinase
VSEEPHGSENDRLGELFEAALSLPADARAAFLRGVSAGDRALRAELDSLLTSHAAAPDFLDRLGADVLSPALAAFSRDAVPAGAISERYEVLERVGSGGMGEVYKARDRSLDRLVALKFLPAHQTADADARARLVREARAASALDHPGIAVVHEIGMTQPTAEDPEGGRLFIAMGYYEGATIRQKIASGPLPVAEALDYAIQLVDALSRAHEAGIVHRDIKPENVVVTDRGQLRIVDFGVAGWTGVDAVRDGWRVGTVAYMSPEQTRGEPVDHRTDIWSVGVVLYEMLTGVRPFRGDTEEAIVRAIREDEATPVDRLRADVPSALSRVVSQCLTGDPALRKPSAVALLADLRAVATARTDDTLAPDERPAVVVLPFADMSPDRDNEYFSNGLTEEVIGELSRIRALRVISRASAMRLRGSAMDAPTLARELGVRYVLEGSVRKAGDRLRITARFTAVPGDEVLWTRTFDGTVDDVFAIQETVARSIVEALRIRLSPGEARALAERPIPDARAYESYLRARYEAWRFSSEGLARAQRYIEAALEMVGENELLYGTLGHITAMHLEAGIDAGAAALDRVERLATRIFSLNPESARAYWLSAFAAFQRGDPYAAIRAGEQALERAPDEPDTLLLLGYVYAHVGRNTEARVLLERAVVIDPLTPLTQCMPGFVALLEGRFAAALEPYQRLYRMDPESPFAAVTYGWVLAYNRRFDEALAVFDDASARFPGTAFAAWAGSLAHALRGEDELAVAAITPAFETAARNSEMFARALAHCYALAGRHDAALDWVEREIDLGMLNYPFLAEHDWFLSSLRTLPRFDRLLERVRQAAV